MSNPGQNPKDPNLKLGLKGRIDFWSESPRAGRTVDMEGRVDKNEMRLGRTPLLANTLNDLVWFTPAILYLHGAFQDRFLLDFAASFPQGDDVFYGFYRFDRALFAGLGAPDGDEEWNHVLFCVEKHFWEDFKKFMVTIVLQHSPKNWHAEIVHQRMEIPDPKGYGDPKNGMCEVHAFGMNGTDGILVLNYLHFPLRPKFTAFAPRASIQAFNAAIAAGVNPVDAAQIAHDKETKGEKGNG